MKMFRITFILPGSGSYLSGGFKVVYEYANRLVNDGFSINIVYPLAVTWNRYSLIYRAKRVYHYFRALLKKSYKPNWFKVDPRIKQIWLPFLSRYFIPKSDCIFATGWETAVFLNKYRFNPGKKYYLIQSLEDWCGPREKVMETWKYPMKKIVISQGLKDIADSIGQETILIENGFDFESFPLMNSVESRNKFSIIMMYHESEFKGSKFGLEALEKVKNIYPQLKAILFGTPNKPDGLPEWMTYYQSPPELFKLYNQSSIYLGTSSYEGFGLTVGEAMQCGCAVVCTDNEGYKVLAKHEETALVSPIGDADSLVRNIIRFIEDDILRITIARNGYDYIKNYTWEKAYNKLKYLIDYH